MDLIRSFISLNIESSLTGSLRKIQDDVKNLLTGHLIKWEKPEKFHLTMRFLGDIDSSSLRDIVKELGKFNSGFDRIEMVTRGIGFFPNQKRPNVVFIDLAEKGNRSEILVNEIDSRLDKFGFKPDKKFVPHVTMGRFRRENRKKLAGLIEVNAEPLKIDFTSFYLMKSVLKPTGSEYEILHEFRFNNL